ncbi:uncharacterized protein MONBRDRAFT_25786 [Monosiga brevicollis MX1]|uniref:C2H2-type domain-containing protein n=1 Tax=Monosiga brevicollis TaxID=81824 RepID=A9V0F2_MONBE|nr:uncharacterized protein MONBRDRAFT_25786 [Monosiga brevicollis MX1]EDQ89000.1 predicted protein [Monosiga brevicollis MX1]|eukprot:XP_001746105.1 hypothetical protein [Monosiga brevicollis MX1]
MTLDARGASDRLEGANPVARQLTTEHEKYQRTQVRPKVPHQYPCTHCTAVLSTRYALRRHIEGQHGGVQRVQCPFCDYTSKQKQNVKRHIGSRHNARVCNICNFWSSTQPITPNLDSFAPQQLACDCDPTPASTMPPIASAPKQDEQHGGAELALPSRTATARNPQSKLGTPQDSAATLRRARSHARRHRTASLSYGHDSDSSTFSLADRDMQDLDLSLSAGALHPLNSATGIWKRDPPCAENSNKTPLEATTRTTSPASMRYRLAGNVQQHDPRPSAKRCAKSPPLRDQPQPQPQGQPLAPPIALDGGARLPDPHPNVMDMTPDQVLLQALASQTRVSQPQQHQISTWQAPSAPTQQLFSPQQPPPPPPPQQQQQQQLHLQLQLHRHLLQQHLQPPRPLPAQPPSQGLDPSFYPSATQMIDGSQGTMGSPVPSWTSQLPLSLMMSPLRTPTWSTELNFYSQMLGSEQHLPLAWHNPDSLAYPQQTPIPSTQTFSPLVTTSHYSPA